MSKIEKEICVINKKGLHARPATVLIKLADKLNASVFLTKDEKKIHVGVGSILDILMLAATQGTMLKVTVEGDNPEMAMLEVENFFNKQDEELAL